MSNKRGLSGIILTIIMIGLVLVAVGIVWVVVSNIFTTQTEAIDYSQKCLGIIFDVSAPVCTDGTCNITVERRATGSEGDAIDGVAITFSSDLNSTGELEEPNNIAVIKTISKEVYFNATRADVSVYFVKEDGTKYYCSTRFSSE
jgi:hypothetical protein